MKIDKVILSFLLLFVSVDFFVALTGSSSFPNRDDQPNVVYNISGPKNYILVPTLPGDIHVLSSIQEKINQAHIKDKILNFPDYITKYWHIHKKELTLSFMGISYLSILGALIYLTFRIRGNEMSWAHWKADLSIDELCAIDHHELGKELILVIQQRYQNPQNLRDFLIPLISFLNDINGEVVTIDRLLYIYNWISILHLSLFFPQQKEFLERAVVTKTRLGYLKQIMLTWITDYKITLYEPQISRF